MWKLKSTLILIAAFLGFTFAVLSILSWISGWEQRLGIAILLALALMSNWLAQDAVVRNAFTAGAVAALLIFLTQAAFLPIYFDNNPANREIDIPFGLAPRTYILIFAPIAAVAVGAVTALLAWVVARVVSLLRKS